MGLIRFVSWFSSGRPFGYGALPGNVWGPCFSLVMTAALALSSSSWAAGQDRKSYPDGSDEAAIWALEAAIYAHRAVGDSRFYPALASEHYLGWPAPAAVPIAKHWLTDLRDRGRFESGEVIDVWSNGISIDADTAISYFSTHRTRLPGGKAVDQRYENIHVWVRRGDRWELVGSMSRKLTEADSERIYGLATEEVS
jgi:hypothetical protein